VEENGPVAGLPSPFHTLPLPYGETWQRWAEAVKQNLEDAGIKVELVATDVAGSAKAVSTLGLE
jgi:ABC-type transport system substrate-binding protein